MHTQKKLTDKPNARTHYSCHQQCVCLYSGRLMNELTNDVYSKSIADVIPSHLAGLIPRRLAVNIVHNNVRKLFV